MQVLALEEGWQWGEWHRHLNMCIEYFFYYLFRPWPQNIEQSVLDVVAGKLTRGTQDISTKSARSLRLPRFKFVVVVQLYILS